MIIRKQATLERFEGKQAILLVDGKQELSIFKEDLASDSRIGDSFTVQILPSSEAELHQQELARTILNQILDHGQS